MKITEVKHESRSLCTCMAFFYNPQAEENNWGGRHFWLRVEMEGKAGNKKTKGKTARTQPADICHTCKMDLTPSSRAKASAFFLPSSCSIVSLEWWSHCFCIHRLKWIAASEFEVVLTEYEPEVKWAEEISNEPFE